MGDSQHPMGPKLGRLLFIWGQGSEYGNMLRGWVAPFTFTSGLAKYLGMTTEWSLTVGVALIITITTLTFLAGWYHVRVDGARHLARLSNANDPWKGDVLQALEARH